MRKLAKNLCGKKVCGKKYNYTIAFMTPVGAARKLFIIIRY